MGKIIQAVPDSGQTHLSMTDRGIHAQDTTTMYGVVWMNTYLHTETVGITGSQKPDAVVGESVEKLFGQVGLLLLALPLQHSVTAVRSVLQQTEMSARG